MTPPAPGWTPPHWFHDGRYTVGVDVSGDEAHDRSCATWSFEDREDGSWHMAAKLMGYEREAFLSIMRAVTSHAALVAALEALVGNGPNEGEVRALEAEGLIDAADMQGYEVAKCIARARAALALARKED